MKTNNVNQDVTIVIVLYKEEFNLIFKTLDRLRSFKIVIIDNANNLNLKKKIQSTFNIEKYILNKKNIGFSAGYNQGAKYCETEYLLILGPDCVIADINIHKLKDYLSKDPKCFLVTPTSYDERMSSMTYSGGPLPENFPRDKILDISGNTCVESALGACMMFKTADFLYIGMFDENFFIYFSDDDLCRRIKKLRRSVVQLYESKCSHTHGVIKLKNKYLKKFVRENYYTFDSLYYYYKIKKDHIEIKKIFKKIPSLSIRFLVKLITFDIVETVGILARLFAIIRFKLRFK